MNVAEFHDIVAAVITRLRLPPGMRVWLSSKYDFPYVQVNIEGRWPDVYDPTKESVTYRQVVLRPEWDSETEIVGMVTATARTLWLHEFDEWVTVDGKPVHDPHPDNPWTFVPRETTVVPDERI